MPDLLWWAIHAIQEPALLACVALAVLSSRRVGSSTPYGVFLFVVATGLWFLLVGDLVFMGRVVLGAWERPGTLADVYTLTGWLILTSAFVLLAFWFPFQRPTMRDRVVDVAWKCLATTAALAVLAFWVLSRPGQDAAWMVRAAFLVADGLAIGALWAGGRRLLRMRNTSLGRLFAFLGAAIVLKTVGDLAWIHVSAHGLKAPWVSVLYPAAGGVAVVGLLLHYWDVCRDSFQLRRLEEPWVRAEQRILRDFVHAMKGLAGAQAAASILEGAADTLRRRGVMSAVRNDTIYATAEEPAWAEVLACAEVLGAHLVGEAAPQRMSEIRSAYRGRP